jgi:RHS repeat-associated protein
MDEPDISGERQSPGTALAPLAYTGQGQTQRTQAGSTSFVNSALGVASTTSSGSTDSYTRDHQGTLVSLRAASGSRYYYLMDGLGSVVGLVNASGSKVNSYSYDPYGTQLSASGTVANPWRYASGQLDGQTGLTKFGARYYDPALGRFTQRDPSGRDLPYAYAGCNPVNRTDPTGYGCTVWGYVGWIILGGLVATGVGIWVAEIQIGAEVTTAAGLQIAGVETVGSILTVGLGCAIQEQANSFKEQFYSFFGACGFPGGYC